MNARAQLLLELADDELILGWRDSEWTGIAPTLEEDVAFSSIAQNEIGHARALYELAAAELGTDADALAFDRAPAEYACAPLVELHLLDWAHTIARRYLYEEADRVRHRGARRVARTPSSQASPRRSTARRSTTGCMPSCGPRGCGRAAVPRRGRGAVAVRARRARARAAAELGAPRRAEPRRRADERGEHTPELAELWEEMTEVRRRVPGAQW